MTVSYHGWTHRPKAQGGTDPIPASEDAGGTPPDIVWAYAINETTPTSVPDDESTYTDIVFPTGDMDKAGGQTYLDTDEANFIHIIDSGMYLVTVNSTWPSGGGGAGYIQVGLRMRSSPGAGGTAVYSPVQPVDVFDFPRYIGMARLYSVPASLAYIGVKARCWGNAVSQDVNVELAVVRFHGELTGLPNMTWV